MASPSSPTRTGSPTRLRWFAWHDEAFHRPGGSFRDLWNAPAQGGGSVVGAVAAVPAAVAAGFGVAAVPAVVVAGLGVPAPVVSGLCVPAPVVPGLRVPAP